MAPSRHPDLASQVIESRQKVEPHILLLNDVGCISAYCGEPPGQEDCFEPDVDLRWLLAASWSRATVVEPEAAALIKQAYALCGWDADEDFTEESCDG